MTKLVRNKESGLSVKLWLSYITVKKLWRTQTRTQDPGYEVMANDTNPGGLRASSPRKLKYRSSRVFAVLGKVFQQSHWAGKFEPVRTANAHSLTNQNCRKSSSHSEIQVKILQVRKIKGKLIFHLSQETRAFLNAGKSSMRA